MKMQCFGCGVLKDTTELEMYTLGDDLCTTEPIPPLIVIECEPSRDKPTLTEWRAAVVCHGCYHRIEPDMWINQAIWESINPVTPFENLPLGDDETETKWDPETYAGVPQ